MQDSSRYHLYCLICISAFHETVFSWNILKSKFFECSAFYHTDSVCVCVNVCVSVITGTCPVKDCFTFESS